ncbi:MAG: MlaD family protein [Sulfurimonadaceae bacterium]|jgi:ABC-type transporter Mla subunit MlaD
MQYNKMKIAVGLFVLTFLVTIAFSSFLILREKGTFDKRYSFYFTTQSANSFNVGMPLKFSGFDIGTIDEIALNDDGSVKITFSVAEKNRKWISRYCVLLLQKPLIGSPHIEIYSSIENPPLEEGSHVEIIISDDINGMISKLEPAIDKLINIITSVDAITSKLSSENSDLFATIKNIKLFTDKLSNGDALLTTITGDAQATQSLIEALNKAAAIMEETHKISKDIQGVTSNLEQDILKPSSGVIQELHAIMKDVKQKLDTLDGTVKSVGSYDTQLLEIKEQISAGLIKSNQLLDKVDALTQDETKTEVPLP